ADVTGVLVAGDKPIGVLGIHECEYVPQDLAACDHVEEMLPPIETWGDEYVAAMPKMRNVNVSSANNNERIFYKIVSAAANNVITLTPPPTDVANAHDDTTTTCPTVNGVFGLGEGQYCEFGSRNHFRISGSQPFMVGVMFSGQDSTGLVGTAVHAGDPSLSLLVPVDQYRRDYSFLVPDTYHADYVTVVFNATTSTIELDDTAINPAAAADSDIGTTGCKLVGPAVAISGTVYSVMHVKLARGAHTMKSVSVANPQREGDRFGIFNYGYDDYVSYGYPGGLDLVQSFTYPNLPSF
ncbi:MAG: IgGFc-binding protein, partial [Deltaproteobacteria bacterium]|nr:IgGFc-binding protein [Deltaproteobacteria bacterium]